MTKRGQILVAAHDLVGGTKDKPFTLVAGGVFDAAAQKKLGISEADITDLSVRGDLVEHTEFVSDRPPPGQTRPGMTGTEFEGMLIDDMRTLLDKAKVEYPKGASAPDLMKIALEHGLQRSFDAAAAEIQKTMSAKAIKAELDQLKVSYETDANEAALSRSLAQARAATASA